MMIMLLMAAAIGAAGPASDETVQVDAPRSASFHIGDLDLSKPADMRRYERRLDIAIEDVCGSYANVVDLTEQEFTTRCRHQAAQSAAEQLAARPVATRIALGGR